MLHYMDYQGVRLTLVQTTAQYPLIVRMLMGLGRVWLASLIVLVFAPLVNAYAVAMGIPLLKDLTVPFTVTAIMVLFLSVPLSWGLGCAGLILEWLGRHRHKPKRKLKRLPRAEDRCQQSKVAQGAAARRLADAQAMRLVATGASSAKANSQLVSGAAVHAALVEREESTA